MNLGKEKLENKLLQVYGRIATGLLQVYYKSDKIATRVRYVVECPRKSYENDMGIFFFVNYCVLGLYSKWNHSKISLLTCAKKKQKITTLKNGNARISELVNLKFLT